MSGTVSTSRGTAPSTPVGRVRALARAELTLLGRSKGALFAALFVPMVLPFSFRTVADEMDLAEAGLTIGTLLVPAAVGFSLLFAVYATLVGIFVTRREELVLKRLRSGESRDIEILAASSLPSAAIGVAQSLLLAVGCTLLLDTAAPKAAHLTVLGLLLGLALSTGLAAVTASLTRTTESAQITSMPVLMVSMFTSGIAIPLEVLPDRVASLCELLPFTPVMTLVRGGFTGNLSGSETLFALATGLAWIMVSMFAVRRWFRWEPRR